MEKVWLPAIGEPTACSAFFFPDPRSRRKWDCALRDPSVILGITARPGTCRMPWKAA